MSETLPEASGAGNRNAQPSEITRTKVPFLKIPAPAHDASRSWTDGAWRIYCELVRECLNRPEHRVTAKGLARRLAYHPRTVTRHVLELERRGVIRSPDDETSSNGRRWRFAWEHYWPKLREAAPDERPPNKRRKGRGNPRPRRPKSVASMETCDPTIASAEGAKEGATCDPTIASPAPDLRSYDRQTCDPRIESSLQDHKIPNLQPPSKTSQVTRASLDGGLFEFVRDRAASRRLGRYELGEIADRLEQASEVVDAELGRRPEPKHWRRFAEDTFHDPSLHAGNPSSLLAVALCSRRVVPYFRERWQGAGPPRAKTLTGPLTAEHGAPSARAPMEPQSGDAGACSGDRDPDGVLGREVRGGSIPGPPGREQCRELIGGIRRELEGGDLGDPGREPWERRRGHIERLSGCLEFWRLDEPTRRECYELRRELERRQRLERGRLERERGDRERGREWDGREPDGWELDGRELDGGSTKRSVGGL